MCDMYGNDNYDEDLITCQYCGHREYPEVGMSGHVCQGMRDASEASNLAFEKSWVGDGTRIKRRITIEYECYNTEASIDNIMSDIGYNWKQGGNSDDILDFSWRII